MSLRTASKRRDTLLLAAAMTVAGAVLLWESRGTYLVIDEWSFFAHYLDWSPATLLEPGNGHLNLIPVLVHKIDFELFGTAFLPLRIQSMLCQIGVAVLIYVYVRRRLGPWPALAGAIVIALFGTAWDVVISPIGLVSQLALIGGLAALLFLDRRDWSGDLLACAALLFSVASFSHSLPFVLGVGVELAVADRAQAWRRAWVPGIPAALYLVWRAWAAKFENAPEITLANVLSLPETLLDGIASAAAGLTGLSRLSGEGGVLFTVPIGWGRIVAFCLVAVTAYAIWRFPARTPRFWATLAALLGFFVLIGVALGAGRSVVDSRYSLAGAVFLLLFLTELTAGSLRGVAPGAGIRTRLIVVLPVVLGISLAGNLANLHYGGVHLRERADVNLAQLTALELVRDELERTPGAADLGIPSRSLDLTLKLGEYLEATERYGSPGYPPAELPSASAEARLAADEMLVSALSLNNPAPLTELPFAPKGPPPTVEAATGGYFRRAGPCVQLVRDPTRGTLPEVAQSVSPDETLDALRELSRTTPAQAEKQLAEVQRVLDRARRVGQFVLVLPPGGAAFRLGPGPGADLGLRRYGDDYAAGGGYLAGGTAAVLDIPPDGEPQPWRALLQTAQDVIACGV